MNYKMKPGSRENDTIGPFRGDSIVNKRFKGPGDVPRIKFTQAQVDTMSQKSYSKLPIFFKTADAPMAGFQTGLVNTIKSIVEKNKK
jgi:hypothetical protein